MSTLVARLVALLCVSPVVYLEAQCLSRRLFTKDFKVDANGCYSCKTGRFGVSENCILDE
jgi:hypothetical protein